MFPTERHVLKWLFWEKGKLWSIKDLKLMLETAAVTLNDWFLKKKKKKV